MSSKGWSILAVALVAALALPLGVATPLGLDTHVVTSEKPGGYGYLVDQVVVDTAGTLTLTNADLRAHDVVAHDVGPDSNPWCGRYAAGRCPLFASPLVGLGGQATVAGLDQLTPSESYTFYCSIHPWMTGTLTAL